MSDTVNRSRYFLDIEPEYSGAAEPQFRSRLSQCSGNCGATTPVIRATYD